MLFALLICYVCLDTLCSMSMVLPRQNILLSRALYLDNVTKRLPVDALLRGKRQLQVVGQQNFTYEAKSALLVSNIYVVSNDRVGRNLTFVLVSTRNAASGCFFWCHLVAHIALCCCDGQKEYFGCYQCRVPTFIVSLPTFRRVSGRIYALQCNNHGKPCSVTLLNL
jgi:hypothetical protein